MALLKAWTVFKVPRSEFKKNLRKKIKTEN